MFMPNIPRRKIYEKMLELEDILLDMHVLLISEENFKSHLEKFNSKFPKLKIIIIEIKVLFIFFLENTKFEEEKDFQNTLNIMIKDENKVNKELLNNKNLTKKFKETILDIQNFFNTNLNIKNIEQGKELFKILDLFNSLIPKVLEIRRDNMK